jgi:ABC-2 type transport system permease protein
VRRVWALAAKDLLQTRRDRLAIIFTLIMPIAFTVFLGILVGKGESAYPLAVANQDGSGKAAGRLVAELQQSKVVKVETTSADAIDGRVDADKVAAGLIIPSGFSDKVAAGEQAELVMVRVAGSSGAQTVIETVRTAATGLVREQRAAQVAAQAVAPEASERLLEPLVAGAQPIVAQSLAAPALRVTTVRSGGQGNLIPSGFDLTSPGMIINFILFSLTVSAAALIEERRTGTLLRLLTTRVRRSELIGGKTLGMFTLSFTQQTLLIVIGAVAFGVGYFNAPLALLLVMIALSVLVSCIGLLLATLFHSEQALIATAVMVSMGMTALSGGWFPLEITGPTFQTVGHALPTTWILDAFRGISLKGWGVPQVLPAVGVAFAWAAGIFGLAVWRFRMSD